MIAGPGTLIRLQPRHGSEYVSLGRTVLAIDRDGQVARGSPHGLFVHETRLLSRLQYLINGNAPQVVACSNVAQHSWLGYYAVTPAHTRFDDEGSGQMAAVSEETIELRVSRSIGDGMHEDIDLINYTRDTSSLTLTVALDADFADLDEIGRRRQQRGPIVRAWKRTTDAAS